MSADGDIRGVVLMERTDFAIIHAHCDAVRSRVMHVLLDAIAQIGAAGPARDGHAGAAVALSHLIAKQQASQTAGHRTQTGAVALALNRADRLDGTAGGACARWNVGGV